MTPKQLRDVSPDLFSALHDLVRQVEPLYRRINEPSPFVDDDELAPGLLAAAVARAQLSGIEQKVKAVEAARRVWRIIARSVDVQGVVVMNFLNDAAEAASLPEPLHRLLSEGGIFDGQTRDTGANIEFCQGDTVVARVPKSLAQFLVSTK